MDRGQSAPLGRERVLAYATVRVGIKDTISRLPSRCPYLPYLLPLPHTDSVY